MYLNYTDVDMQYEVSRTVERNIVLLIVASVITLQKKITGCFLFFII